MAEGSYGRFIHGGLVGPKPRPKGVGDGQTVDIPLPLADDQVRRVTGWGRSERGAGVAASKPCRRFVRGVARGWGPGATADGDSIEPRLQEKPRAGSRERPYRKPTLVAGCESTKVDG